MDKIYYVYELIDPASNEVFYVGKGKENRYKHHQYNRKKFPNRPVSKRICAILETSMLQYNFPYKQLTESQSFEIEQQLISQYGRLDLGTGPLLNQTHGGEGWSHGRKWSTKYRQQRIQHNIDNPRGHEIKQYDLDGNYIQTFSSANHAIRALNLSVGMASRIRECCKFKANSAAGYMWGYVLNPTPFYHKSTRKPVDQFAKTGEFIKTFESIQHASDVTGINAGDIATMCRGSSRYKSVGGYVWKLHV